MKNLTIVFLFLISVFTGFSQQPTYIGAGRVTEVTNTLTITVPITRENDEEGSLIIVHIISNGSPVSFGDFTEIFNQEVEKFQFVYVGYLYHDGLSDVYTVNLTSTAFEITGITYTFTNCLSVTPYSYIYQEIDPRSTSFNFGAAFPHDIPALAIGLLSIYGLTGNIIEPGLWIKEHTDIGFSNEVTFHLYDYVFPSTQAIISYGGVYTDVLPSYTATIVLESSASSGGGGKNKINTITSYMKLNTIYAADIFTINDQN